MKSLWKKDRCPPVFLEGPTLLTEPRDILLPKEKHNCVETFVTKKMLFNIL